MARKHVIHDVIRQSRTVTLTVNGQSASKTVYMEEPVDIYLDVDDSPYNNSVYRCADHVDNLRNSVLACNAAEVASKVDSARRIGKSVSKGFLGYVTANINIQNMEECSNREAVIGELQLQSEELVNRKEVMRSDYGILTTRYSALFKNLDEELARRIHLLLQPCYRFVESSAKEQKRNADTSLLAMTLVGHKEQIDLQAQLCTTKVKQRAVNLIKSAKEYLLGQKKLATHIDRVLIRGNKHALWMLPVILLEKVSDKSGSTLQVVMNQQTAKMGVNEQTVRQEMHSKAFASKPMDPDVKQKINQYIDAEMQSLGSSEHDRRVAEIIRKMVAASAIQVPCQ